MPCDHEFESQHLVRAWGLLVAWRPRIGITCCLSGDLDFYDENVAARTRRFADENPAEARELCEKIVDANDYAAMHAFISRMKDCQLD